MRIRAQGEEQEMSKGGIQVSSKENKGVPVCVGVCVVEGRSDFTLFTPVSVCVCGVLIPLPLLQIRSEVTIPMRPEEDEVVGPKEGSFLTIVDQSVNMSRITTRKSSKATRLYCTAVRVLSTESK